MIIWWMTKDFIITSSRKAPSSTPKFIQNINSFQGKVTHMAQHLNSDLLLDMEPVPTLSPFFQRYDIKKLSYLPVPTMIILTIFYFLVCLINDTCHSAACTKYTSRIWVLYCDNYYECFCLNGYIFENIHLKVMIHISMCKPGV